jgi:hypothetical protein
MNVLVSMMMVMTVPVMMVSVLMMVVTVSVVVMAATVSSVGFVNRLQVVHETSINLGARTVAESDEAEYVAHQTYA